jgi:hypothetical protein
MDWAMIVPEFYRVERMNANWGSMAIATVLFSNVLNMQYGLVFDADSGVNEGGETVCMVGVECYEGCRWHH